MFIFILCASDCRDKIFPLDVGPVARARARAALVAALGLLVGLRQLLLELEERHLLLGLVLLEDAPRLCFFELFF